jgi:hypothetical protein
MRLVQKNLTVVASLSSGEKQALKTWWAGGQQDRICLDLLTRMHSNRLWLACDCLGAVSYQPLMAAVKKNETYFIRRMTERAAHSDRCVFFFEQVTFAGDSGAQAVRLEEAPSFAFESASPFLGDKKSSPKNNAADTQPSAQISSLARKLFWLAEKSGMQSIGSDKQNWRKKILEFSEHFPGFEDVRLKQILFCSEQAYTGAWFDRAFYHCQRHGIKPGAWWILPVHWVNKDTKTLTLESGLELAWSDSFECFGGDLSPARFPMLALIRVNENIRDGSVQSVYLHPQDSLTGALVDSDYERNTLHVLNLAREVLQSEQHASFTISKPLHALSNGERPDFVLHHNASQRQVIVETMGYENQDYINRKKELTANFPGCRVIEDWPGRRGHTDQPLLSQVLISMRKAAS